MLAKARAFCYTADGSGRWAAGSGQWPVASGQELHGEGIGELMAGRGVGFAGHLLSDTGFFIGSFGVWS